MPIIDYRAALNYNRIPSIGRTGTPSGIGGEFRSATSPASQSPTVTPDTVVPGPGGQYRDWSSFTQLASVAAIANPGDVLRQTASIGTWGEIRGTRWGLGGTARDGILGNHITITTADPTIKIDAGNQSNNKGALDVIGLEYVDVVKMNVENSQFGIRILCCGGDPSSPIRIARNRAKNIGHSAYSLWGWWTDITGYGGTPPAGAGNELGFTNDFIFELNEAENSGLTDIRFGEAFYFGRGANPGWVSRAEDGVVRYNVAKNVSELIDIKLGCLRIDAYCNVGYELSPSFGAASNIFYHGQGNASRPSWVTDPQIYYEQNRHYDINITNTRGGYLDCMWVGLSGVRVAQNEFWATAASTRGPVLISERSDQTDFGTDPLWFINNLFWVNEGIVNRGYGVSPTITPFTLGAWYTSVNNIGPTGISGVEFTTGTANFEGPAPAVNVLSTADSGPGPGSGFKLINGHTLGAGTTITPEDLYLEHDMLQYTIPASNPDPGPFQTQ